MLLVTVLGTSYLDLHSRLLLGGKVGNKDSRQVLIEETSLTDII